MELAFAPILVTIVFGTKQAPLSFTIAGAFLLIVAITLHTLGRHLTKKCCTAAGLAEVISREGAHWSEDSYHEQVSEGLAEQEVQGAETALLVGVRGAITERELRAVIRSPGFELLERAVCSRFLPGSDTHVSPSRRLANEA